MTRYAPRISAAGRRDWTCYREGKGSQPFTYDSIDSLKLSEFGVAGLRAPSRLGHRSNSEGEQISASQSGAQNGAGPGNANGAPGTSRPRCQNRIAVGVDRPSVVALATE
jgi:hypothetical protein